MNTGIIKLTIIRCILVILLSLIWFTNCSNLNNISRLVNFICDISKNNALSGNLLKESHLEIDNAAYIQNRCSIITSYDANKPKIRLVKLMEDVENYKILKIKNKNIICNRKYENIPKGTYKEGDTYTVKHGDTLFYIAWITNNNFQDLAKINNISAPYNLNIGQILKLNNSNYIPSTTKKDSISTDYASKKNNTLQSKQKINKLVIPQSTINHSGNSCKKNKALIINSNIDNSQLNKSNFIWRWPTDGKIIENFSPLDGRNKGIDIAGIKGQFIAAAADGKIVYVGNALRGYGNLIIIKHNDDYLSAYAHNDIILVHEQQEVKIGQKIATMGSSGTNSTRLHFEIRYKGKSVNPLKFLPKK